MQNFAPKYNNFPCDRDPRGEGRLLVNLPPPKAGARPLLLAWL